MKHDTAAGSRIRLWDLAVLFDRNIGMTWDSSIRQDYMTALIRDRYKQTARAKNKILRDIMSAWMAKRAVSAHRMGGITAPDKPLDRLPVRPPMQLWPDTAGNSD